VLHRAGVVAPSVAPLLGTAVAQPEDGGPDVGRLVHRLLQGHRLALAEHDPGGLVAVADGAGIEAVRHLAVGQAAPASHRLGELGMFVQPVVDRAVADLERLGEVAVGGAGQAQFEGLLGEFRLVVRGPSGSVHDPSSR
jgi:hypothetical protein